MDNVLLGYLHLFLDPGLLNALLQVLSFILTDLMVYVFRVLLLILRRNTFNELYRLWGRSRRPSVPAEQTMRAWPPCSSSSPS